MALAVRAISDVEPLSTEMPLSEDSRGDKVETTVALDYSAIELDDGELLHVYGVPGQRYRELMWPMVCEGALGVIVVGQGTVLQVSTIQTGKSRIWCGLAPRQTERRESRIGHPRVDGSHSLSWSTRP